MDIKDLMRAITDKKGLGSILIGVLVLLNACAAPVIKNPYTKIVVETQPLEKEPPVRILEKPSTSLSVPVSKKDVQLKLDTAKAIKLRVPDAR